MASDVSDLDSSEESFSAYQEKIAKIWKHKNKEFIAAQQKAFEDRVAEEVSKRLESTASKEVEESVASEAQTEEAQETEEDVSEVLDSVEVEQANVVNNNESSSETESLRDRLAKTFKQSIKISY